ALSPATPPEILEADLTPLALELAAWGASGPDELAWLDPPPQAPYGQAIQLLGQLGALDQAGRLTAHGRRMAGLGLHPRLAQMLLRAWPLGLARPACLLAGLLEAPGALKGGADLRDHLAVLMAARSGRKPKGGASSLIADEGALRSIDLVSKQWERLLADQFSGGPAPAPEADWERYCGLLVSFAYPDRMAKRRSDGRYLLRSGRGAAFHRSDPLAAESYLAIADVDDGGIESRIWLAAPFEESWFSKFYHNEVTENRTAEWDEQAGAVRARKTLTLDALVLKEVPDPDPDPGLIQQALIRVITEQGAQVLPWNPKARQLQSRILFLRELDAKWPDVSDEALAKQAEEWFLPYISDMKKKRDLQSLPMQTILETRLGWELCRELDREAPSHLPVPSGSKVQLQYDSQGNPFAAVRLQEVFGMLDTPRIGYGTVPVVLHLLSPASRPVQVTSDLANFWQHTYFEVKKDLKGRYPKHYWPDDPWTAQATRKVRPDGAR
ncbi:ATP-dependent helicase C-terminal domain-containing protein, partial [Paenibacillus antibioticophila]|uniref:ATP-dependent helicase C-terminal domain-containing protein n=1 Tax=Paenibacillus antibioticophila TaxID=1274374 RepID=UPI00292A3E52